MQTFLPYPNFKESAKCLDYRRLGKQRVEAWQIYLALTNKNYGWKNHPIIKMWRGYEQALLIYGMVICVEWKNRGYVDNMLIRFLKEYNPFNDNGNPKWIGNINFHNSHKSNLLRKDKEYYGKFNWNIKDNLSYVWFGEENIA